MRKPRFVWIDDKKDKVETYRAAIEDGALGMRAEIELLVVKHDILEVLDKWTSANVTAPPDLLIIDHVYNPALPFGLKGSSVAHLLRGRFPAVPMVCVTAMFDRARTFDQEDLSEYSALFLYQQLGEQIEQLYAIARDFRKLRSAAGSIRAHMVACLKAPKRDQDHLLRILPDEFRDEKHATTLHRAARWIFNVLLKRPGFLYDRKHAATLLGLTEPGFKKVELLFGKALYRGVFATQSDPRWWTSSLRELLYGQLPRDAPDLPQHAGRMLPGVGPADHSICYVTKKSDPPPDAVVATDATRDAVLRVVRREFADVHPLDAGVVPGFEAKLVLRGKRK